MYNRDQSAQTPSINLNSAASDLLYLAGVDGGGTGTRVVLSTPDGQELARGTGGPGGLALGRAESWQSVMTALKQAFEIAGIAMPPLQQIGIGLGLAGVTVTAWREEFLQLNPGFGLLIVESDAYTTLLGAHGGEAGAIIALGTGSVGEALYSDGSRLEVGGWGFPIGDEASGAWLGWQAVNYLQRVLDGRQPAEALALALEEHTGNCRDSLFAWMGNANQTRYASLAPTVIRMAEHSEVARQLLQTAGQDIAQMAAALTAKEQLSIALCGGLAPVLKPYIPQALQQTLTEPQADSATGAMLLVKRQSRKLQ